MKYVVPILIVIFGSLILSSILPWWSVMIIPFLTGYVAKLNAIPHVIIGFVGIFFLWGIQSYLAYTGHAGNLASRIGVLFGGLSPITLLFISAFFGGLCGGTAQLTGHFLNKFLSR